MLDRKSRDKMATIIESYLDERITAFAFDEQIHELARQTEDKTVQRIRQSLWYFYDDLNDHKVDLGKEAWDYWQRLMLILRSDASIKVKRTRVWSWRQPIAGLLLAGFAAIVIWLGWGSHLHIYALPFGVASIALACCGRSQAPEETELQHRLAPFTSISQIFVARRAVPAFTKRSYPVHLVGRPIRSRFMSFIFYWQFYGVWAVFGPIVLFFQLLPRKENSPDVSM